MLLIWSSAEWYYNPTLRRELAWSDVPLPPVYTDTPPGVSLVLGLVNAPDEVAVLNIVEALKPKTL